MFPSTSCDEKSINAAINCHPALVYYMKTICQCVGPPAILLPPGVPLFPGSKILMTIFVSWKLLGPLPDSSASTKQAAASKSVWFLQNRQSLAQWFQRPATENNLMLFLCYNFILVIL